VRTPRDRDQSKAPRDHITWLTGPLPTAGTENQIAAWPPRRSRWAVALERIALAAERVVNRVTSAKYNPLYYTGTIAFFLLLIVGLTGLYLFLFFQYGYDASWGVIDITTDIPDNRTGDVRVAAIVETDIAVRRAQSFAACLDIDTSA